MSDNPPPTSVSPRPSSPASISSWASSMLPPTPTETSPTPNNNTAHASLIEREAALLKAYQELADEQAELARAKSLCEQERNAINRKADDLEVASANLEREKEVFAARQRPESIFDELHEWASTRDPMEPLAVLWALACIIPIGFAFATLARVQVGLGLKFMGWAVGVFGV
ncbi:hypothetical protein V492_04921 [Pseudogymnoascus sp. VKM F-4246]|nr:hypothetical protein V492_04921 [Pseudogymnoascus sp. VKM F-4246]